MSTFVFGKLCSSMEPVGIPLDMLLQLWFRLKPKLVPSGVAGNCQDYFSTISQLSPFVSLTFSKDRLFLMAGKIPSKAVIPHRKPEVWS